MNGTRHRCIKRLVGRPRPVPRHRSEGMDSTDSSAAREGGRSMLVARAVPPQAPRRASSASRQREPWTARLTESARGHLAARNSPVTEDTYRAHSRERGIHRSGPYTIIHCPWVLHAPFGAPRPTVGWWADSATNPPNRATVESVLSLVDRRKRPARRKQFALTRGIERLLYATSRNVQNTHRCDSPWRTDTPEA